MNVPSIIGGLPFSGNVNIFQFDSVEKLRQIFFSNIVSEISYKRRVWWARRKLIF